MSETVIKVENLGKSYIIHHEQHEKYKTLRDVIVNGVKAKTKNLFKRNDLPKNTEEEFWALQNVNFEIKQGDRIGIIGRNGAGKSTLLKMLSRISEPTTGRITIAGRVASLLEVGTGFHPELTGHENIFLNGAILGMSREEIKRKFDDIVAFAEIEKFLDTPVKRYSSGMYVRLAFAVAAHLESEILIVDEVLAVGDSDFQKKCLGKMEEVSKGQGRTVLLVSHNIAAIKALCDKGILLENGKIKASGEIDHVVESYLTHKDAQGTLFVNNNLSDEKINVRSVKVINEKGELVNNHPHTSLLTISVDYELKTPLQIFFSVHIHDSQLETVIFSRDFEYDENNLNTKQPGDYTLKIKLPAILVPGSYNISLHMTNMNPKIKLGGFDHICPFEIIEFNDNRSKFGLPIRGKVLADIHWTHVK